MELTKKQKNCPYCHATRWGDGILNPHRGKEWQTKFMDINGDAWIDLDNRLLNSVSDDNLYGEAVEIDYCPKCGRPLNKEPE